MKTRTFTKLICFLPLFILGTTTLMSQDEVYEVNTDFLEIIGDIDPSLQNELIEISKRVFAKYATNADFWDESTQAFSNEKFSEISSLFAGTSRVFNDVDPTPTNIDIATYTLNMFETFQNTRVEFELSNVDLLTIEHKLEEAAYIAIIKFDKTMLSGMEDGVATRLSSPRSYEGLEMEIEMPEYDIEDTRILNLVGTVEAGAVKVKKAKSNLAYLGIGGFYGINSISTSAVNDIGSNFGSLSPSGTSLGVSISYRKAMTTAENLFLLVGIEGRRTSIKSDFSNYQASASFDIGNEFIQRVEDNQTFNGAGNSSNIPAVVDPGSIQVGGANLEEDLTITFVKFPVGVGIKLGGEPYSNMFFLDILVTPSYSLSATGSLGVDVTGIKVPDDPNFPTVESVLAANPTFFQDNPEYNYEDLGIEKSVTTTSTFGLGVRIAPRYYLLRGFRTIISIGAYAEYSILTPIASTPSSEDFYKFIGTDTNQDNLSLLEEYFDVTSLDFGIELGFAYKFGAQF